MAEALPYWRLSSFYFFYFAIVGVLVPYWAPYLKSLGFSAAQIGELLAITNLSRIVAPSVWGALADRLGQRMRVVRAASLVALVAFLGVFLGSSYGWLAAVMLVFTFFWNAALPQYEANTLNHLWPAEHRYSRIRLWGSVGFIVAVVAVGWLVDRLGVGLVPYAMAVLFGAVWLSALWTPEREGLFGQGAASEGFWQALRGAGVPGFFLACFFIQLSHGPYYAFFSIYLQERGYSWELIGPLWALGVVAEIGVFLVIHRWLPVYGARRLLTAAFVLAALRWLLIGALPEVLALLVFAQLLHAASFGVYHAVGIATVNRIFRGRAQGRGQALYSMTYGLGVSLGSLLSGYLWLDLGGMWVFVLAALAALASAWMAQSSMRQLQAAD